MLIEELLFLKPKFIKFKIKHLTVDGHNQLLQSLGSLRAEKMILNRSLLLILYVGVDEVLSRFDLSKLV